MIEEEYRSLHVPFFSQELRAEDYLANRKGGSSGGGLLGATGMAQPENKPTGLFGQPASTASTGFSFNQNKNTFGNSRFHSV